jgi:predicted transcriptional regulator
MDDLDIFLSVIENPTRRRILEALVREPHYPLQLSRELGLSQQGIMKHLKVLEDSNLVRSHFADSDQGGPARRLYVPTTGFTIMVDIGPGLFSTEIETRVLDFVHDLEEEVASDDKVRFPAEAKLIRQKVAQLDEELERLMSRRTELIKAKEEVLNEAGSLVERAARDYQVRRVLYEYLQRPDLSGEEMARVLGLRDDFVEMTIKEFTNGGE